LNGCKMAIDFVKIPIEIYKLHVRGLYEVSILALIYNFNNKGFRLSNGKIAKALFVHKRTIERAISSLKKQGHIRDIGTGKNDRCLVICTDKLTVSDTDKMSAKIPTKEGADTDVLADHNEGKNINKDCLSQFFNDLWKSYPKKTSKAGARRQFNKLKPDKGLFDTIMQALQKHKLTEQWQKENGKYIPKLMNWLQEEKWEDELPELDDCGIVQTQDCEPAEAERLRIAKKAAGY
jgi:hypothetical protein